jgi:hypothetical protein
MVQSGMVEDTTSSSYRSRDAEPHRPHLLHRSRGTVDGVNQFVLQRSNQVLNRSDKVEFLLQRSDDGVRVIPPTIGGVPGNFQSLAFSGASSPLIPKHDKKVEPSLSSETRSMSHPATSPSGEFFVRKSLPRKSTSEDVRFGAAALRYIVAFGSTVIGQWIALWSNLRRLLPITTTFLSKVWPAISPWLNSIWRVLMGLCGCCRRRRR